MMNIHDFCEMKKNKKSISMLTCYDYTMARILNSSEVNCLLVGDSLAMVMHGFDNTLGASVEMMALHTRAVCKGAPQKFVVGDLPFMSYRKGHSQNMTAIETIMKSGAHAVKLEGAEGNLKLIHHSVQSGAPVMGHLGLTPQSVHQLGGFKVQGRDKKAQEKLKEQSLQLQDAGCFSIVLECVPATIAEEIAQSLEIPVIGIGAGSKVDGQVLVLQDMLGMNNQFQPKFLKKYLDGFNLISEAANTFHSEVQAHTFPGKEHSYL